MNKGQRLLKLAKKMIPGGNQLLSKRSEMFLPGLWPAYYKKAVGCKIWDMDNKQYYDFAGMGVTCCTLGYGNKLLNKKIIASLKKGNMATLNAYEEVDLAKEFLKIHKWANMAKFCKSGGEASLVSIRIARAFSKKQNIAFCGYHGWHDWYLGTNLKNKKNLNNQHLSGLKTVGVSSLYKDTIKPFYYNDINSLKKLFKNKNHNIGIIIMEPMRSIKPDKDFLKKVRTIANKNNAVLIFDEITSGFKDNFGGIHLKFGVNPDIAIFGKSIANGYPISVIIGKKKIMNSSQDTFISSTMWTDRLGFVAALETLRILKKESINKKISNLGVKIKTGWKKLAKKNNLDIDIMGLNSVPSFKFNYSKRVNLIMSTFFTQEMLNYGYLASTTVSTSNSHNEEIVNKYLKKVDKVFYKTEKFLKTKNFPLKGEVKHDGYYKIKN